MKLLSNKKKVLMIIILGILLISVVFIVTTAAGNKNREKQQETAKKEEPTEEKAAKEETAEETEQGAVTEQGIEEEEKMEQEETVVLPEQAEEQEEQTTAGTDAEQEGSKEETTATGNGHKVAIDPGHQGQGNSEQEPIGPGAGTTKAKVASGTSGAVSGLNEYELTLQVSLQLRDELAARGYEVVMIRETHDVNISNSERAQIANTSGSEIFLRIHANGDTDSSVSGALTMAPSASNPYVGNISDECQRLSQNVLNSFCEITGAKSRGVVTTDTMSGINWCTIPVTIVEMGFMTNADEDAKMASEEYQYLMVQGIADGVDQYFAD